MNVHVLYVLELNLRLLKKKIRKKSKARNPKNLS